MRPSFVPKLLSIPMIIALAACSEEKETAPPIRPVLSSVIELSNLPTPSFAGTVAPKTETPLGFRVGGLMVARDVNTGDVVTKGELLASLEPTSLELAVRSSQAELANAQAQLANARSSEERARAIFQGGTGTKSSLESSVQATQTAQSAVVQAQTALDKSNEDLSYAQLLATFDGIVTATSVEVGQVVSAGESVLTVAMPGERDAVIDIPEGELIPAIGDAYSILLQINPSVTSMGAVREVAPTADAATRTRRVKIALQNPPDAFRIGTTITAIRQARDVKKLFLPASAILSLDGKTSVWIVDEKAETVRSQEVRLRDKTSAHPEVVSGLEPGTRVVIAGVHSLKEGQKIKVGGGARS